MERCLCGLVWTGGGVSYRNRDREGNTGLGFEVSSQLVGGLSRVELAGTWKCRLRDKSRVKGM